VVHHGAHGALELMFGSPRTRRLCQFYAPVLLCPTGRTCRLGRDSRSPATGLERAGSYPGDPGIPGDFIRDKSGFWTLDLSYAPAVPAGPTVTGSFTGTLSITCITGRTAHKWPPSSAGAGANGAPGSYQWAGDFSDEPP